MKISIFSLNLALVRNFSVKHFDSPDFEKKFYGFKRRQNPNYFRLPKSEVDHIKRLKKERNEVIDEVIEGSPEVTEGEILTTIIPTFQPAPTDESKISCRDTDMDYTEKCGEMSHKCEIPDVYATCLYTCKKCDQIGSNFQEVNANFAHPTL